MLASCSLSATINKLSRFMDDSGPAKLNFSAVHARQCPRPAEKEQADFSQRRESWQGEQSAPYRTGVMGVIGIPPLRKSNTAGRLVSFPAAGRSEAPLVMNGSQMTMLKNPRGGRRFYGSAEWIFEQTVNAALLEKESKGGQPAVSATADPSQSSPRDFPFLRTAGTDSPGRRAARTAPG